MSKYDLDDEQSTTLDIPEPRHRKRKLEPEVNAAVTKGGEGLGFIDRSPKKPSAQHARRRGRRSKEPQDRILVAGPLRVLSAFRDHCERHDLAYWEAIEKFLAPDSKVR